ncbi:hypothetical protein P8605_25910 [Streptomyces sp. T-3]|nr:hypothetical protein [Streptomyces sp. T-3]
MEKRIDQHAKNAAPLNTAAIDPAYIPGIVPPARPAPVDDDAEAAVDDAQVTEADASAATDEASADAQEGSDAAADGGTTEGEEADGAAARSGEAEAEAAEGPEFEATDRRGAIVVDATGVRFRLDEEACEFTWDEISAVEQSTSRFGRRFTVTVHTPNGRWYPGEVQAADKATLGTWADQLDKTLDAYFEE